jgi:hypothetical protein
VKQPYLWVTMLSAFTVLGSAQTGASRKLSEVQTIYVLPMSSGMDQYLASRLTRGHILQVVTDPAKADAILTDHLGAAFEDSLKELYPELKPAPEKPDAKAEKAANQAAEKSETKPAERVAGKETDQAAEKSEIKPADKAAGKEADKAATGDSRGSGSFDLKPVGAERTRPSTRARGTIFLVKRGSWEVLWSAYREPRARQGKELDRTAGELVNQLKASLKSASATTPADK